jgi:hypothetical protein
MAFAYDPMSDLARRKAQLKATGQPDMSIAELQAYGGGVMEAKSRAELSAQGIAVDRERMQSQEEQFEGQQRRGDIASMTSMPTSMVSTYALGKQAGLWGQPAVAGGAPGAAPAVAGGAGGVGSTGSTFGAGAAEGGEALGTGAGIGAGEAGAGGFFAGAGGAVLPAAGAGAVAGAYGPYRKEAGSVALLGKGGEREQDTAGGAIAGAGAGAAMGFAVTSWSGPGAIVGTVVGAIVGGVAAYMSSKKGGKSGGKSGGTVICTELLRQGLVSEELVDLEHKYHFDWDVYWGYRIWADPVVEGMKKSKLLTLFMSVLGRAFLQEVAHRVEPGRKRDLLGSLIIKVGSPICKQLFWYRVKKYSSMYMWQQEMIQKVGE